MPNQPNIILCVCDELRWCETACYGHSGIRTPNIDGLAESGIRMETAVSNDPVCMPARSIMLSGQYARTCTGSLGNAGWKLTDGRVIMPQWPAKGRITLGQPTLPELLRKAGYHTSAIGKWHIEAWPHEIGFDHYVIPAVQHAHTAQWFTENGGPLYSPPGYSIDHEKECVGRLMRERSGKGEPFFLYYNISPPHMPLADAPERYRKMYRREEVVVRPNVDTARSIDRHQLLTYLWDYRYYRDHLPYAEELPWEGFDLLDLHAMYMGLTTWVDDTVGGMMKALRESGLDENTLVVFTSDHGDNLGSFGLMGKASLNEESIRVPMIATGPSLAAGKVSGQVAGLVDLAPTLLEFAQALPPAHMQGQSLKPVWRGEKETLPINHTFVETGPQGIGIRTLTHLLGLSWDKDRSLGDKPNRFYDLVADPYELQNLAGQPSEIAADLERKLREWDKNTAWMKRPEN